MNKEKKNTHIVPKQHETCHLGFFLMVLKLWEQLYSVHGRGDEVVVMGHSQVGDVAHK